ncbi:helix-turn-helix domain-containing protein [Pyrobaculum calidifontis]|nr:helix-turn-helix transcriptional regulator [Pyrobaculum calidifontis]
MVQITPEERAGVIRCLVEELEYGISDIARAAGVSPAAVSQWHSGKNTPTADKLERLYQSLGEAMDRCLPELPLSQLDIAQAVNVIAKALRSKTRREHVIKELSGCSRACN